MIYHVCLTYLNKADVWIKFSNDLNLSASSCLDNIMWANTDIIAGQIFNEDNELLFYNSSKTTETEKQFWDRVSKRKAFVASTEFLQK